jgi:hypothetical protein
MGHDYLGSFRDRPASAKPDGSEESPRWMRFLRGVAHN